MSEAETSPVVEKEANSGTSEEEKKEKYLTRRINLNSLMSRKLLTAAHITDASSNLANTISGNIAGISYQCLRTYRDQLPDNFVLTQKSNTQTPTTNKSKK